MVWVACGASTVFAHGGVSVEDDVCLIKIDRYKAHFTGYLPRERATQEFCEDIPIATQSIFVIDYISDELREMELDFRVIRDVNELGVTAVLADLGGEEAIKAATVYYAEPKRYHKGVMNIRHTFTQNGGYIGIVNANHLETGLKYTSVFPFSVGQVSYANYIRYFLALFAACGVFIYAGGRGLVFKVKPPRSGRRA
ncbi:hypothetical protein A9Q89_11920 [Gammaproteobacteria bacterium 53_120_T64]|nr:hypothetical protein A9Q89_11920 [Gammaproteobacteria bacterium 53_120_T64]